MLGRDMSREWIQKGNSRSGKPDLALVLDSFYLYVDRNDTSVAKHLLNEGHWESWVTSWCTRVIQQDWNCLDIGANFGYYTGVMARLSKGRIYAFEPNPVIADMLQKSIDLNDFDNVKLIPYALGSEDDTLTLSLSDAYQGSASLLLDEEYFKGWDTNVRSYQVPVRRLDDVVGDIKKWDFIKIDVEGWEPEVFKGAEEVLSHDPLIAIEISPTHPAEFLDMLFNEYDVKDINTAGVEETISRTDIPTRDWWMLAIRKKVKS